MKELLIEELKERNYHKTLKDFNPQKVVVDYMQNSGLYSEKISIDENIKRCLSWWIDNH